MKNIHIISTDKPSRLWTNNLRRRLELDEFPEQHPTQIAKHIYITNSEEIKEEDWYYLPRTNSIYKCKEDPTELNLERRLGIAKVILTTDPELIADGVQSINDEFLEWFVKNPSCEEVEVGYGWIRLTETDNEGYWVSIPDNQFEMQQEEPKCTCKEHDPYCCQVHGTCPTCVKKEKLKQECTCENPTDNTCDYCEKENKIEILKEAKKRALEEELEEAAEQYAEIYRCPATNDNEYCRHDIISAINFGAKWQAERMCSSLSKARNEFYAKLSTENIDTFELLKLIKLHLQKLDDLCGNK